MYLLKNAWISISRNKGRNILIGIIIIVMATASTVTLAIKNTASNIVEEYKNANDIIGTISFNRDSLMSNFKGGEDAAKENIEKFNNVEQITIDKVEEYGNSEYLKGYYYMYATSLDSDTLAKATDTYEYEVEDRQSSTKTTKEDFGSMPPGFAGDRKFGTNTNKETTITITRRTESFGINRALTGMFELDGYSSYDAMTDFSEGTYQVTDGEMITNFDEYECVINEELAKLNEINVGDTIELKNSNKNTVYQFKVVGIYKDNSEQENTRSMYSSTANTVITGAGAIAKLASEDSSLVTNIEPSFVLKDEESIDKFAEELQTKELSEYYTLTTNLEEIEGATKSIKNVGTFATTFLIITLIISAIVLFIINMINIRERKYEIGVFRTIGLSKSKLTGQFIIELAIVSVVGLMLGAGIGACASSGVGNYLLQNEIDSMQSANKTQMNNFGFGGKMGDTKTDGGEVADGANMPPMEFNFNRGVQISQISDINAIVGLGELFELLGIGFALVFVSSLASMISIQKFSPLTILKERS